MKHVTLMFLRRPDGELLLAMKKRGFGAGKWNGAGGKVEPGETPLAAAIRETEEEVGVTPKNARKVAELDFFLTHEPGFNNYAHVFVATEWDGEPRETEEMRPQWFAISDIPYDQMWGDDKHWLPQLLAGRRFKATYTLDEQDNIVHHEMHYLGETDEF